MSNYVNFNQDLVDKYFNNWIGISTYNTENYDIIPSCFGLYFPTFQTAKSSYAFLIEWGNWLPDSKLILSIVKETDSKFSFYIYKENRNEFVKGTFEENLLIEELDIFLKNEQNRKFVVLARFPDENNNIIDNPSQSVILINGFKFDERSKIKAGIIENK